jgi:transcriptional regulator with XRE-family HTH domain
MQMLVENLIENINSELSQRGWSKAELARRAEMSVVTISRFLHGHQELSISACEKIAKAFHVSPEKLVTKKK